MLIGARALPAASDSGLITSTVRTWWRRPTVRTTGRPGAQWAAGMTGRSGLVPLATDQEPGDEAADRRDGQRHPQRHRGGEEDERHRRLVTVDRDEDDHQHGNHDAADGPAAEPLLGGRYLIRHELPPGECADSRRIGRPAVGAHGPWACRSKPIRTPPPAHLESGCWHGSARRRAAIQSERGPVRPTPGLMGST